MDSQWRFGIDRSQAAARIWVRAGAEGVVIVGRRKDVLQKTADELNTLSQGKTKVLAVAADVVSEKDTENLYAQVKQTFGRTADVVLASAGAVPASVPFAEQDISTWWTAYVRAEQDQLCPKKGKH